MIVIKNYQKTKKCTDKITVLIPTYNRSHLIEKAINSVLNQSLKDWQLLIFDDGSEDNTELIVKHYVKHDKRISYYKNPINQGICHVLNTALTIINTDYFVQLDSDDWLEKDALKLLQNHIQKTSEKTALVYGNHKSWLGSKNGKIVKQRSFSTNEKYDLLCYSHSFYPRCYRTKCLKSVGGWDVNDKYEGRYMEDRRIFFKLIEKYNFLWIDYYLYNLSRNNNNRLTTENNRTKYNEIKKDLISTKLLEWGDIFKPKFTIQKSGWLKTELIPQKKGD